MLAAFHALADPKIRLHLYSTGCEDLVKRFAAQDGRIRLHAPVSHEKIGEIYRCADVLINVENSLPEFMPSKLFEYIAACRPIVSFGSGQSRQLLAKHPAALLVSDANDAGARLRAFLEKNHGRQIAADEIETVYERHSRNSIHRILIKALSQSEEAASP